MVEAERVEFAAQNMLGHHASRGVGRADEEDRTKARLTRSRAFRFHIGGQEFLRVKCYEPSASWHRDNIQNPHLTSPVKAEPSPAPEARPLPQPSGARRIKRAAAPDNPTPATR